MFLSTTTNQMMEAWDYLRAVFVVLLLQLNLERVMSNNYPGWFIFKVAREWVVVPRRIMAGLGQFWTRDIRYDSPKGNKKNYNTPNHTIQYLYALNVGLAFGPTWHWSQLYGYRGHAGSTGKCYKASWILEEFPSRQYRSRLWGHPPMPNGGLSGG